MQGSGTGVSLNTLFILKTNDQDKHVCFKINSDQIFEQAQKILLFKKLDEDKVEIQDRKTCKAITLSIPADDIKYIKKSSLNWNRYLYSREQLSFEYASDHLIVSLCVGIYPENYAGEIFLGSISFDFGYQINAYDNTISINLSNLQKVEQF